MAFHRRNGQRFTANVWPGFVDAMTALLLVLMFVLSIFMIVQFILSQRIADQDTELDALGTQVASLARALGLEQQRAFELEEQASELAVTLSAANAMTAAQAEAILVLQGEAQELSTQIASFEAQVAWLLADRDRLSGALETSEAEVARVIDEREALQLALAQVRTEVDAQAEAARLDAARREALEALVADLRAEATANATSLAQTEEALSDEEAARLAEAAAAQALRDRLRDADAELTAMTLALEEQRQAAEETLTLLAASETAQEDLTAQLAAALLDQEALRAEALGQENDLRAQLERALDRFADAEQSQADAAQKTAELRAQLAAALAEKLATEQQSREALSAADAQAVLLAEAQRRLLERDAALNQTEADALDAQREAALLNQQVSALRSQLGALQSILDEARARDEAAQVQLESLGSDLNAALAQVAAEQRRRADLEEAERQRLEAEAQDLERFRSEFFGQLRDLLEGQDGVQIVGDRFVFSSEVLFAPGSDLLSPSGRAEIAKVAELLQGIAGDIPVGIDWVLQVDGHTDNVPLSAGASFANNWELSQARALSVVLYMVNQLGLPPERLSANGFGEYQPVNSADTAFARAQNRRIELKFTEK